MSLYIWISVCRQFCWVKDCRSMIPLLFFSHYFALCYFKLFCNIIIILLSLENLQFENTFENISHFLAKYIYIYIYISHFLYISPLTKKKSTEAYHDLGYRTRESRRTKEKTSKLKLRIHQDKRRVVVPTEPLVSNIYDLRKYIDNSEVLT